jgi:hypothetical protein
LQQTEEVSASSQGMEIAGNFSLIFGTPSDKVIGDELTPASSTSSSSKLNSARIVSLGAVVDLRSLQLIALLSCSI